MMVVCLLLAASRAHATSVAIDRELVNQMMSTIQAQLQTAVSQAARGQAIDPNLLESIQNNLSQVRRMVATAPVSATAAATRIAVASDLPGGVRQAAAPAVAPIDETGLASLRASIERESFSQGKLRVLEQAAASHYFLAAQVRTLLGEFSFANDRMRALELLAPRLVDRNNAFVIYDALTFTPEKQRARQLLER
jgi:hypothetical protein